MSLAISVRHAHAGDVAAIFQLLEEADAFHRERVPWLFTQPSGPARSANYFEDFLGGERAVAVVAESDGGVVGVVLGTLRETPTLAVFQRRRIGVIEALVVGSAWRRRGAGSLLTHAVEAWAIDKGAGWVELNVYEANPEARLFYERLGFATVSSKLRKAPGR